MMRWKYNILSALDYFDSIAYPYDDRMDEAITIIKKFQKKGRWGPGKQMAVKISFPLNKPREGSPFNTLRALRVLQMYD